MLAFFTFGLTLLIVPLIMLALIGWLVWTIFAIAKAMSALGRGAPMRVVGYW